MTKPIRCAIIGQSPMRFPWGFDEGDDRCRKLKIELAQQIMVLRQSGVSQFLVACDCGVGLYAAEIVNGLRATTDHDLMLICYTASNSAGHNKNRVKVRRGASSFSRLSPFII